MLRVPVNPAPLHWARERTKIKYKQPVAQFRKLLEWESGQAKPSLKQLVAFARKVHIPFDCLFLFHPPEQSLPNALDHETGI